MPSEEFIDLVHDRWRNRLLGTSTDEIDSYAEQVKTCIKMALNCVDNDRHKRPNIGDIISELDETETMTQFSQALTINNLETTSFDEQEENGLLEVHPRRLRFPFFEPNKSICALRLSNKTDDDVAFRILSEKYTDLLSEFTGIVPPRSAQTYCVLIEKKPPASMKEFVVTLESCIAHEDIADVDDNFLPEVLELTEGNMVHTVTLLAAICDPEPHKIASKVICRSDPSRQLSQIDVHPTEPW
uniref:Uncharacterized protein n=1 Tax=Avena sativa TaxID=4498 RepID=A0ACD5UV58_AVESA